MTVQNTAKPKFTPTRITLVLLVALTVVNSVSLIFGGSFYFPFSVYLVYFLSIFSYLGFTGEWTVLFDPEMAGSLPDNFGTALGVITLVLAALVFLCYVLWVLLYRKGKGILITAIVFYSFDTLFLLFNFDVSLIFDIILHILALVELFRGLKTDFAPAPVPVVQPREETEPETMTESVYMPNESIPEKTAEDSVADEEDDEEKDTDEEDDEEKDTEDEEDPDIS